HNGSKSDNIATNISNTGSYDWTVPADTYTDGGYKIKIIDFDNSDNYGITNSDFIIYNESLKGTWIEKPDNGYKIIFEELIMHIEEDSDEDGTYEPLTEGDYNYDKTNNTLHSNFTKIAPSAVGDDESTEELVELPYTFEQSIEDPNTGQDVRVIITVNSAELTTSFVFNNESPAEGLLGAFLNNEGDPLVLNHSGDWKQTMIIKSEIITQTPPAPSNTQTINDDTGQSYKFDSQGEEISLTYKSYERTGLLTTESEEVTETAVWGSLDTSSEIKTFSVTEAPEDNVRLINGTYKYRVIEDAILISRPEEAGGEAPIPQYLEKEEEE
ncbi:MAG: Ser-Thr-rich GPI-anchored membrane family protein, partial [Spirochaetota bacterium]